MGTTVNCIIRFQITIKIKYQPHGTIKQRIHSHVKRIGSSRQTLPLLQSQRIEGRKTSQAPLLSQSAFGSCNPQLRQLQREA